MSGSRRPPQTKWAARAAAEAASQRRKRWLGKIVTVAVLGVLISVSTGTWVDDFSARRPGLWKMVTETGSMEHPTREVRICLDKPTEAALFRLAMGGSQGTCDSPSGKRRGDTMTTDMVCTVGETRITTRTIMTFKGDTEYHREIKAHFDPPTRTGRSDATSSQDAKWLGPCPDDMRPGDIVTPSGARSNLDALISANQ